MKKRIFAALSAVLVIFTLVASAFAADVQREVIDCGDGYYMVVTVDSSSAVTRAGTVYRYKSADIYNSGTQIGEMTVYGEFDISGSTAKALAGSVEGSGMNGWSYKSGSASCSGNKVTGTAKLATGATTKSFPLTMTCSPSGVVS